MSLVNDMLRDLDRRKRNTSDGAVLSYGAAEKVKREFPKWLKQVAPVVIGLFFGLLVAVLFFGDSEDSVSPGNSAAELVAASNSQITDQINSSVQTESEIIRIEDLLFTANGYSVNIVSDKQFEFDVISRDEFGISLLLPGIESVEYGVENLPGFSVLNSSVGTNIYIEMNEPAIFSIVERNPGESSVFTVMIGVEKTGVIEELSQIELLESNEDATLTNLEQEENRPALLNEQQNLSALLPNADSGSDSGMEEAPVRKPRELTFEEQDHNVSQQASSQIQAGQLMSAYQILLKFIGENPEAHKSRVTLATLLFAQQEYGQANVVVDQGIALAPNYSGYKKIKSRILLLNNQPHESALILEEFPPSLEDDAEYFELLASSFQKSGEHIKAIEIYQDLIRYNSQQGRWWAALGISHEALGNAGDAVASYQAAMQLPNLESALRQYSQSRIRNLGN